MRIVGGPCHAVGTTVIHAGTALAWNPSIAGVKVEDTTIVGADGTHRIVTSHA